MESPANRRTTRILAPRLMAGAVCAGAAAVLAGAAPAQHVQPCPAAAWELKLLGADDAGKLKAMRDCPKLRRVKLGVVGSSGVSRETLKDHAAHGHTFTYHDCADPKKNTHDTAMVKSILDKMTPLGVQVDLQLWQWKKETEDCPGAFRAAGGLCDVVCFYQSFWGKESPMIATAIRESPGALFLSPYVGRGKLPSGQAPQGHAHKPWAPESIGHFVTVTPVARRQPQAGILSPLNRGPQDCQAINFIAPSYHASGPGGTCYGCEVGAACAVYLYAVMPGKPDTTRVISILRDTSALHRERFTSVAEFDDAGADKLANDVRSLLEPPEGKQRKLDAPGVLDLYAAFRTAVGKE